jgi:hypothetical protein
MEHFGQQDSIGAFLAVHQMSLELGPLVRGQVMVEIPAGHRMLIDITVVHTS